jgi:hypothetical protein
MSKLASIVEVLYELIYESENSSVEVDSLTRALAIMHEGALLIEESCNSSGISLESIVSYLNASYRLLMSNMFRTYGSRDNEIVEMRLLNRCSINIAKAYASEFDNDKADFFVEFLCDMVVLSYPSSLERMKEIFIDQAAVIELLGILGYHSQRLCAGLSYSMKVLSRNRWIRAIKVLGTFQGITLQALQCFDSDDIRFVHDKNIEWFTKAMLMRASGMLVEDTARLLDALNDISHDFDIDTVAATASSSSVKTDFESVGLISLLRGIVDYAVKYLQGSAHLQALLPRSLAVGISLAARQCLLSEGCCQDKTYLVALHMLSDIIRMAVACLHNDADAVQDYHVSITLSMSSCLTYGNLSYYIDTAAEPMPSPCYSLSSNGGIRLLYRSEDNSQLSDFAEPSKPSADPLVSIDRRRQPALRG